MEKRVEPLWKVLVLGFITCGFYIWWYLDASLRELSGVEHSGRKTGFAETSRTILSAFCLSTVLLLGLHTIFLFGEGGSIVRLHEKWSSFLIALFLIVPFMGSIAFGSVFFLVDQHQKAKKMDVMETLVPIIIVLFSLFVGVAAVFFIHLSEPGAFVGQMLVFIMCTIAIGWLALVVYFNLEINRLWREGYGDGAERKKDIEKTKG